MPVAATFAADFTAFQTAVDKAVVKLRSFEDGAHKADQMVERIGNRFSGVKVIQEALAMEKAIEKIGGASKLTAQELIGVGRAAQEAIDKATALGSGGQISQGLRDLAEQGKRASDQLKGKDGIAGSIETITGALGPLGPMIATTFSVGAVVGFAKELGSFAGQMVDLSDQTGIAVEDLQALDYVAAGAGLTIEDVTGAVSQLSNRLASGDDSAAGAMERLGVSTKDLLAQSPDQALITLADAVAKVPGPMERTAIAMDLFGKSGPRMLRLMTDDFGALVEAAKTSGAVIDEELIRRADAFDDAWTQAVKRLKAELGSIVLPWLRKDTEGARADLDRLLSDRAAGKPGSPHDAALIETLIDQVNAADSAAVVGALAKNRTDRLPAALAATAISDEDAMKLAGILPPSVIAARKKQAAELKRAAEELRAAQMEAQSSAILAGGMLLGRDAKYFAEQSAAIDTAITAGQMQIEGLLQNKAKSGKAPIELPRLIGMNRPASEAGATFAKDFGISLQKGMGPAVLGAVMGGGSVMKTASSVVGQSLTSNLFKEDAGITKAVSTGLTKMTGPAIGKAIGSMIPVIGSFAGPAIEMAMKGIGKLLGSEGKETNKARDAALAQYGTQDQFRKLATEAGVADAELKKVFSTSKVKDFEAALAVVTGKINAFNSEQAADAARLNAAYEKYGFTFEEIGIKAQQSKLNDQAKELIEDWRVLVGSGIDVASVNDRMSEAMNTYLQTALKVGAELPAAMRPILDRMIEQGTLTDEAGNAITDLEAAGVSFSETMTEGFDRVVSKLDELIEKLIAAGDAIGELPSMPSLDTGGGGPSESGAPDLPSFATGTGGRFLNFGKGTPVMLHGREAVVRSDETTGGGLDVMAASIQSLQTVMLRAIRENALTVRDHTLLAMGRT